MTRVKVFKRVIYGHRTLEPGETVEVPEVRARSWTERGLARSARHPASGRKPPRSGKGKKN